MDADQFDALTRSLTRFGSRRRALGGIVGGALGLAGWRMAEDADAHNALKRCKKLTGRQKKACIRKAREHNATHCAAAQECGSACCADGQFCCDDVVGRCCASGEECCNPGSGSGVCCADPNRCGRPYGNDSASPECCPPSRQWTSFAGVVRCCPPGSRALPNVDAQDGPCCPEAFVCLEPDGTPHCCNDDDAPQCCQGTCCAEDVLCCGGSCCDESRCQRCVNDVCEAGCKSPKVCLNGVCECPDRGVPCGAFCCSAGGTCCNPESGLCCFTEQECCNKICYNARDSPHTPCGSGCCQHNRVCCPGANGLSCRAQCD